ncbi:MAG TPA: 1-acyl-sn-glycerol-3-phosphate acyltransferase [Hyphomonas sp.]|nr:1-acyl-sn-glycerol-3-phosphate acyltransferase [Hyphomonas sp.]HRX73746.1 1-acyl-sn-glycerol-3-phosphate acyltransferase [Hyphomonas sp.]
MRGTLFTIVYYILSTVYVLVSVPFLILPGHTPVRMIIRSYTRAVNMSLRLICGIRKEVRGRSNLPEGGFIVAGKHQSWGDGFLVYPEIDNLAFVTGDHLEKFPLVGGILRKLGAIVIDTCGGGDRKAASLREGMERARDDGRRILIYPEGHLAPVGYHFRYKPGVWHMAQAMQAPVVPVATNIGVYWQQQEKEKRPGTAIIEFLEPISWDLPKDEFLARLTEAVEQRTAELVAEGRGTPVERAVLIPDPPHGMEAKPTPENPAAYAKA